MHLIPTQEEVIELLRQTGALKSGHFQYPDGLHANAYLQVPLAMRYAQHAKTLSVGLSRIVRANPEIRAILSELSIVAPAPNGLPVAYGMCEALRAKQVYWAAREGGETELHFPQYLEQYPGEKVLIVDDILRTGKKLKALQRKMEANGVQVVGVAVIVYQPAPDTPDFTPVPVYSLAKLDAMYYKDAAAAEHLGIAAEKVWV